MADEVKKPYSDKNYIEIAGRAASDPRFQFTSAGKAVAEVTIFSNRKWLNSDGSTGEKSTKVKLTAWGDLAEAMHRGVNKGDLIIGIGQLSDPDVYIDKKGDAQAINCVTIFSGDVIFKKNGQSAPAPKDENAADADLPTDEDLMNMGDIPF